MLTRRSPWSLLSYLFTMLRKGSSLVTQSINLTPSKYIAIKYSRIVVRKSKKPLEHRLKDNLYGHNSDLDNKLVDIKLHVNSKRLSSEIAMVLTVVMFMLVIWWTIMLVIFQRYLLMNNVAILNIFL